MHRLECVIAAMPLLFVTAMYEDRDSSSINGIVYNEKGRKKFENFNYSIIVYYHLNVVNLIVFKKIFGISHGWLKTKF